MLNMYLGPRQSAKSVTALSYATLHNAGVITPTAIHKHNLKSLAVNHGLNPLWIKTLKEAFNIGHAATPFCYVIDDLDSVLDILLTDRLPPRSKLLLATSTGSNSYRNGNSNLIADENFPDNGYKLDVLHTLSSLETLADSLELSKFLGISSLRYPELHVVAKNSGIGYARLVPLIHLTHRVVEIAAQIDGVLEALGLGPLDSAVRVNSYTGDRPSAKDIAKVVGMSIEQEINNRVEKKLKEIEKKKAT